MANKFSDQVGGFISLYLKGNNPERIINLALARGIFIWDIKKQDEGIQLKVRTSGFEAFKTIINDNHFEMEVVKKQGLPFYKTVMKRRLGLIGGAMLFTFTLYLMSSFVWFVDVSGNNKVERSKILMTSARHGIYPGAAKWNFSRTEVEEAMLRDLSEIAYIQCDIRGVKADIKVVEKILPDGEISGPCHLVAARDGVVEEIMVLDGQSHVKTGDVVAQGDILISGIVFPTVQEDLGLMPPIDPQPYLARARGQVKARTWYEGYGECKLKSEEKIFSGKEINRFYLETPWKRILLKGRGENHFAIFEQSSNEKIWSGHAGNWGFIRQDIKEQLIKTTEYSEKEAVNIARERALSSLQQEMPAGLKVSDSHFNVLSSPSDSIVRIKVFVETTEDISVPQPIDGGKISK